MKHNPKRIMLVCIAMILILLLCACGEQKGDKQETKKELTVAEQYEAAQTLLAKSQFAEAAAAFEALGEYEEASKLSMYCQAAALGESGQYNEAIQAFESFGTYKSSTDMASYYQAREYESEGKIEKAIRAYNKIILFRDSAKRVENLKQRMYDMAQAYADEQDWYRAYTAFTYIWNNYDHYSDCDTKAQQYLEKLQQAYAEAKKLQQAGKYTEAIAAYQKLGDYSDCFAQILECEKQIALEKDYQAAKALQDAGKYEEAIAAYKKLNGYGDSAAQIAACESSIQEREYRSAKALQEAGKYAEAYTVYAGLKGYKDVDNILSSDENLIAAAAHEAAIAPFKTVGNVVTYGHYEQDNNTKNGKEPIEWQVLEVQGNKALLISKYGLDAQRYNTEWTDITWETCTLRSWLNSTFLNAAFTAEEQKGILTTAVDNSKAQGYSDWDTDGGNNTQDRIFLLSYAEANKYFKVTNSDSKNTASRVAPTDYAIAQWVYASSDYKTSEGKAAGYWWLRSPGSIHGLAAYVYTDGSLSSRNVSYGDMAVRPAFWLDLDKCVIESADAGLPEVGSAEENNGNMKKPEEAGAKEGRSAFMTVGNVVTYGHYEQDNNKNNGKEPIEWIVLDVQGNNALLISKYGLDAQPYNTERKDITWETCTLRSWLNSTFLNAAFTAEEQKGILTTAVDNSKAQGYFSTNGGNTTQDKIFLLSYAEANKYFKVTYSDNTASRVAPTAYAIAQGARPSFSYKTSEGKAAGNWWLRSPGFSQDYAMYVVADGSPYILDVSSGRLAVRPAFWLDLDKCVIESADAGLSGVGSAEENNGNMKKPEEAGAKEGRSAFMTVGNVVTYGHYEQDNNKNNGKEPIEWIVLDVQGNKVLLISKYGLDAQPYNTEYKDITWEKCTLRSWLNSTFLNAAFTAEEQKGILTTAVDNSKAQGYSDWDTDGGNNTQDKIFLLSYAEANKYFGVQHWNVDGADQNTASRVAPTAYAIAQGAFTDSDYKTSEGKAAGAWWLRSPGHRQNYAAYVYADGSLSGSGVNYSDKAARPAFWLDLESGIF